MIKFYLATCSIVLVSCNVAFMQHVAKSSQDGSQLINQSSVLQNVTTTNKIASKKTTTDPLVTAPTVTSVHQVWTSSSSDNTHELLTPEMISRLHGNVPFLTAYALRPRLVAPQQQQQQQQHSQLQLNHEIGKSSTLSQLDLGAASAPLATRQSVSDEHQRVSKINDFNELNVETSSVSKSEHHHRRKTSLKKQPNKTEQGSNVELLNLRRHHGPSRSGKLTLSTSKRGQRSAKNIQREKVQTKRRRNARRNKRLNSRLINHNSDEVPVEVDSNATKGGSDSSKTKRPFYQSKSNPNSQSDHKRHKESDSNDSIDSNNLDKDDDDAHDGNDIGNDVVKMPNTDYDDDDDDGVVVDNPTKDYEYDEGNGSVDEPKSRETETTTTNDQANSSSANDPRGNRVNRQKPNVSSEPSNRERGEEVTNDGVDGQVVGGGIGTTIGAGDARGNDGNNRANEADDGSNDASDGSRFNESGVEFADEDLERGNGRKSSMSPDDDSNLEPAIHDATRNDESNFGDRRHRKTIDNDRRPSHGPGRDSSDSIDDDVDYRDELDGTSKGDRSDGNVENSSDNPDKPIVRPAHGHSNNNSHNITNNCDDGSYNHHDEHHHHHNHDTIDWLRGSIPGEPDVDYPIRNRINATNFKCSEQKYAGYYADVEARCQIFHVCQPDGRQDSFLCPNGTIFNQRTLVCVWWSGFECEDATKYYHLNKLLYKSTDGNKSPQSLANPDLRPLDKSSTRLDGATNSNSDDEEEGTIDSLVKEMKHRIQNDDDDDDEKINRKPTVSSEDNSDSPTSARLRQRVNKMLRGGRSRATRRRVTRSKSGFHSTGLRKNKIKLGARPRRRV